MQTENATINHVIYAFITEACIYEVSEIYDLACVIQELKKYKARVLKCMQISE